MRFSKYEAHKKLAGCWWLTPVNLAIWAAEIRRITVQGQSGQTVFKTPISKITTAKWMGDLAQAVEFLLCKCEQNPSLTKKKKKKALKNYNFFKNHFYT
jgi:hypothetical protein